MSWSNGDPLAGGGGIGAGAHSGDTNMAAAVSGKLQQQQQQQQQSQEDSLAVAQNGGLSSSDEGDMDGDGDDLDDDMMDRISSSPSIEDGAFYYPRASNARPAPLCWPQRVSSLPLHLRSRSPSLENSAQSTASVVPFPLFSQHHRDQALQHPCPPHDHHHRHTPTSSIEHDVRTMAAAMKAKVLASENDINLVQIPTAPG